jgi:hypothetical protein
MFLLRIVSVILDFIHWVIKITFWYHRFEDRRFVSLCKALKKWSCCGQPLPVLNKCMVGSTGVNMWKHAICKIVQTFETLKNFSLIWRPYTEPVQLTRWTHMPTCLEGSAKLKKIFHFASSWKLLETWT